MQTYTGPISRLIEEFSKLPGVGRKTAQRLAFHVINMNMNDVEALSKAIVDAKKEIRYCSVCYNITDKAVCSMCSNKNRDDSIICVVEDPRDVAAMEKTKEFNGTKTRPPANRWPLLYGWKISGRKRTCAESCGLRRDRRTAQQPCPRSSHPGPVRKRQHRTHRYGNTEPSGRRSPARLP